MNPKVKIVAAIKALGYNQRQVSVRERGGTMSYSFYVTIRDPKVDFDAVEKAAMAHEDIDRDQYTGEILCGGNTFIHVEATDEVVDIWAKELEPVVQPIIDKLHARLEAEKERTGWPYETLVLDDKGEYHIGADDQYHKGIVYYRITYYKAGSKFGDRVGGEYLQKVKGVSLVIRENQMKVNPNPKPQSGELMVAFQTDEGVNIVPATVINDIELVRYSERAIALFGEGTKAIKDKLGAMGGKFNYFLKKGNETKAGWIFPVTRESEVRQLIGA